MLLLIVAVSVNRLPVVIILATSSRFVEIVSDVIRFALNDSRSTVVPLFT